MKIYFVLASEHCESFLVIFYTKILSILSHISKTKNRKIVFFIGFRALRKGRFCMSSIGTLSSEEKHLLQWYMALKMNRPDRPDEPLTLLTPSVSDCFRTFRDCFRQNCFISTDKIKIVIFSFHFDNDICFNSVHTSVWMICKIFRHKIFFCKIFSFLEN